MDSRMRKKKRFATAHKKGDHVSINLPSSFAECVRVNFWNKNGKGPADWNETIYAGRWIAGMDEKVKVEDEG